MNEEIEEVATKCSHCQKFGSSPLKAPLLWPSQPWSRLHLDGSHVPCHCGCPLKVVRCPSYADNNSREDNPDTQGLPQQIVTNNGTTFTSDKFKEFLSMNGIKHTFSTLFKWSCREGSADNETRPSRNFRWYSSRN